MTSAADTKAKLDALLTGVADETTAIGGIETFIGNLSTQITALQAQVANADVPQSISDQIDAIAAAVTSNKQRILDDIKKGT